MKHIKMYLLASMVILFTACGGGGSTTSVNPDTPQTIAIDKISAYADDNTLPLPTVDDYIAAGIVGVTSENLDKINEEVDRLEYADVDTQEEIQAIFDSLGLEDNANPTITLIGLTSINLAIGDIYSEPGATATDNIDDDAILTNNIVIGGDIVDTTTVGTYTITYNVSDAAGNAADPVIRTVIVTEVLDTIKPVITLIGEPNINLLIGATYSDEGATAIDDADGDISANIVVGGDTVDTSTDGTYFITYDVSDSAGNEAIQVTRTVNVTVGNAPIITLNGDNPYTMEVGSSYVDPGATATDIEDGNNVVVSNDSASSVNTSVLGNYTVTYTATDSNGNTVQAIRTVIVEDTTSPVITLTGSATINLFTDDTYIEEGATCTDNYDPSCNVIIGGDTVDTSTVGTYRVTYDASDISGNAAVQVTRTVNVDTIVPVNLPPTAVAGIDKSVQLGGSVTINGSGSDSDGTVVSYEWKKGNTVLATTASFNYTPSSVGTDTLTLTVTDDDGATDSDSMNVTVTDVPAVGDEEVLLYNDSFKFSVSDKGFHILIDSGDIPASNWLAPHDFYNGEMRIRYIVQSPADQQAGALQTCIWTKISGNISGNPESCSDIVSHSGVGTYYTSQLVPEKWWKKTIDGVAEPLDFENPEYFMFRSVLRGQPSTCVVTTWPVDGACPDQYPNYENMVVRVTIVMVANGTSFTGWVNYP